LSYKTAKGNINQLILSYIPAYSYLEAYREENSKINIGNIKEKKYTGYIEYRTIEGVKLFTLIFRNGKLLDKLFEDILKPNNSKTVNSSDVITNGTICEEVCTPLYSRICWEAGDPPVEECTEWEEYDQSCSTECYEVPDDPDNPDDPCFSDEYFYLCNPEIPNDPPPTPDPTPDPCGEADKLEQNSTYKNEMLDLKSKTNLDKEVGYFKTNGNSSEYREGTAGTLSWNNPQPNDLANGSLERMSHTHYAATGSYPIFSGADVDVFTQYVGLGKAANLGFTLSVTTSQGTSYALVIEDKNKFNSFFSTYGSGNGRNILISIFDGAGNPLNKTPDQNEASFISFLGLLNTGIAILKSNNDFTVWNKRINNSSNNTPSNAPCN
jgi:hypothetical protein